jgi:PilZ domain-containing protein
VIDNRTIKRLAFNLPVIFRWRDRQGVRRRGKGFTRDLSSGGMFVVATNCPPSGTAVKIDLLLPGLDGGGAGLRVAGRGRVLRVENDGGQMRYGFAARNDTFSVWEFENRL